jgi:hypothetical protein
MNAGSFVARAPTPRVQMFVAVLCAGLLSSLPAIAQTQAGQSGQPSTPPSSQPAAPNEAPEPQVSVPTPDAPVTETPIPGGREYDFEPDPPGQPPNFDYYYVPPDPEPPAAPVEPPEPPASEPPPTQFLG